MLAENSKYVEGTNKRYSVTECGRVYMHSYVDTIGRLLKGRWIKFTVGEQGYSRASIFGKLKFVHRLVAGAFIGNPSNKPSVNHIDCDKSNNNVSNLEWVTRSENTIHAYDNNRIPHGENHLKSKLSDFDVIKIRELIKSNNYKMSEIGHMFGVSRQTIYKIKNNLIWKRL